jgi:hypothetical protein
LCFSSLTSNSRILKRAILIALCSLMLMTGNTTYAQNESRRVRPPRFINGDARMIKPGAKVTVEGLLNADYQMKAVVITAPKEEAA